MDAEEGVKCLSSDLRTTGCTIEDTEFMTAGERREKLERTRE